MKKYLIIIFLLLFAISLDGQIVKVVSEDTFSGILPDGSTVGTFEIQLEISSLESDVYLPYYTNQIAQNHRISLTSGETVLKIGSAYPNGIAIYTWPLAGGNPGWYKIPEGNSALVLIVADFVALTPGYYQLEISSIGLSTNTDYNNLKQINIGASTQPLFLEGIPEPSTLSLGLVGLLSILRKRR